METPRIEFEPYGEDGVLIHFYNFSGVMDKFGELLGPDNAPLDKEAWAEDVFKAVEEIKAIKEDGSPLLSGLIAAASITRIAFYRQASGYTDMAVVVH